MDSPNLAIDSLDCVVGDFSLRGVSLSVPGGEYHLLLGPTGSGKSTLIKCVLGLLSPSAGRILLGGEEITSFPPERRRLGYLPQNYALFPHLDVEQNILFSLKSGRISSARAHRDLEGLLSLLKIESLRKRRVRELSGGEKQKTALARALLARPRLLLLDEPFSAVDEGSRRSLWLELKRAAGEIGVTVIHITHHLDEAYTLGERISVLIDGKIRQSGSREEIFERPGSPEVARYLNYRNIFAGPIVKTESGWAVDLGHFRVAPPGPAPAAETAEVCLRPQDLKVIREDTPVRDALRANLFSGEIVSLFAFPEYCLMRFKIDGSPRAWDLELKFPAFISIRHRLAPGKRIRVAAWAPSIIVF